MKGKKSGGQGLNFNIRYFGWNSPKIESYIRRNTDSWSSPWRLPLKFWYGHLLEMFYLRLYIFGRWDIKLSLCRKDFGQKVHANEKKNLSLSLFFFFSFLVYCLVIFSVISPRLQRVYTLYEKGASEGQNIQYCYSCVAFFLSIF